MHYGNHDLHAFLCVAIKSNESVMMIDKRMVQDHKKTVDAAARTLYREVIFTRRSLQQPLFIEFSPLYHTTLL